jgi:hypothetical protein
MVKMADTTDIDSLPSGQGLYDIGFFSSLESAKSYFDDKSERKYCHYYNMKEDKYFGYSEREE